MNQWCQKCSALQIIEPMTKKTWGPGCVILGEQKNKELIFSFLSLCYPPRPLASVGNSLLDLQNSSHPTQPYFIVIAKFVPFWYTSVAYLLHHFVTLLWHWLIWLSHGSYFGETNMLLSQNAVYPFLARLNELDICHQTIPKRYK